MAWIGFDRKIDVFFARVLRSFGSETQLAYAMDGLIAWDDAENSVTSWDDDRLVKFEFDHENTILHFL